MNPRKRRRCVQSRFTVFTNDRRTAMSSRGADRARAFDYIPSRCSGLLSDLRGRSEQVSPRHNRISPYRDREKSLRSALRKIYSSIILIQRVLYLSNIRAVRDRASFTLLSITLSRISSVRLCHGSATTHARNVQSSCVASSLITLLKQNIVESARARAVRGNKRISHADPAGSRRCDFQRVRFAYLFFREAYVRTILPSAREFFA